MVIPSVEESDPHAMLMRVMLTDMEKCYDGFWRQGLYLMLSCMGVEQSFLLNIRAWLENTVMHLEWNRVTEKLRDEHAGVHDRILAGCILLLLLVDASAAGLQKVPPVA